MLRSRHRAWSWLHCFWGCFWGYLDGFHGQHHSNISTQSKNWFRIPRRSWFIATPNIIPLGTASTPHGTCYPLCCPKREDMIAPWWKTHVVHWVLSSGTKSWGILGTLGPEAWDAWDTWEKLPSLETGEGRKGDLALAFCW